MSQLDRTALINKINNYITPGVSDSVTASEIKELFTDIVDSLLNLTTDASLVGMAAYNPSKTYSIDSVTLYNGEFYVAVASATGSFDAAKWRKLVIRDLLFNGTFSEWNSSTAYVAGNLVKYKHEVYKSLADTTGEAPDQYPAKWSRQVVNNGAFGNPWVAGLYKDGDIVKHNDRLYQALTGGAAYLASTSLETELVEATPKWRQITGDIRTARISISSAEMLALNTTPKLAIAAPGTGKYIEVLSIAGKLNYNSAPYSGNGISLRPVGSTEKYYEFDAKLTTNNTSIVMNGWVVGRIVILENVGMELYIPTANPTGGNSSYTIELFYSIKSF